MSLILKGLLNYICTLSLNDLASIANIVIASLTFGLAYYVFIYQKEKDNNTKIEAELISRKNLNIQWFKEIIILPKIQNVFTFYDNINSLRSRFITSELSESEKIEIINFLKFEQSNLRKSFLDLIQHISYELHKELSENLDLLTDHLTNAISNDELKLNNPNTYNREVNIKIQQSYSDFLSKIFNYNG